MSDLAVKYVKCDKLSVDPSNARTHGRRNLDAIKASLEQFGQRRALIVMPDMTVIAGNGTLEAVRELGWEQVAVTVVPSDWTVEQAKAYALVDNRTAELAAWDSDVLLKSLSDLELAGWHVDSLGWNEADLARLDGSLNVIEDEAPEPPVDPVSKQGDVWHLGRHRLLVGDARETLEPVMQGEQAQMVFTDPPWNVNYGSVPKGNKQGYKVRTILNDNQGQEFGSFCDSFVSQLHSHTKPGASVYVVMSAQEWPVIHKSLSDAKFHWSSTIIWAKDQLVLSRKDYHTQYEPIWYGWNSGAARLVAVANRKQSDVWQIPRPKQSELHPTMKPVELVARAIVNSSERGGVVLDPFVGSGTTVAAAEQTDRTAVCVELDPAYADVTVERWQALTGEKATRGSD
jgi:DNA modification methylase